MGTLNDLGLQARNLIQKHKNFPRAYATQLTEMLTEEEHTAIAAAGGQDDVVAVVDSVLAEANARLTNDHQAALAAQQKAADDRAAEAAAAEAAAEPAASVEVEAPADPDTDTATE
jgi:hypothetical protein